MPSSTVLVNWQSDFVVLRMRNCWGFIFKDAIKEFLTAVSSLQGFEKNKLL